MTGHIKLGTLAENTANTMRHYQLYRDVPDGWKRYGLNPQAPKIASGTKSLEDQENWEYWVQETWEDGIGRMRPHENGGMLYSELLSYVPNQLTLPLVARETDSARSVTGDYPLTFPTGSNIGSTITLGSGNNQKMGIHQTIVLNASTYTWYNQFLLLTSASATQMTYEIWTGTATPADGPQSLVKSHTASISTDLTKIYNWHDSGSIGYTTPGGPLTGTYYYWIVIYPTSGTVGLLMSNADEDMQKPYWYNGANWSAQDTVSYMGSYTHRSATAPLPVYAYTYSWDPVNNVTINVGGTKGWYWDNSGLAWTARGSGWGTLVSETNFVGGKFECSVFGTKLYVFSGATDRHYTWTLSSDAYATVTSGSVGGGIVLSADGFLYAFGDENIYYTGDGSTWSGPFSTGTPLYKIRGAASLDGQVYFANEEGIFIFAPGDFIVGVAPWGVRESQNGMNLLSWKGMLYCLAEGGIAQISTTGQITDIWLDRQADLPASRLGSPFRLASNNNYLFALVTPTSGYASVWAYDGRGWSHICVIPSIGGNWKGGMYFDRVNSKLWVTNSTLGDWYVSMPDDLINPVNDSTTRYYPSGWIEWDWWQGGVKTLDKDFESVTLISEGVSATQTIAVYWKDDESTDWELLGTATANDSTLRWSSETTRPATKKLKLALKMNTSDQTKTPVLRTLIVRYRTKTNDRYGWRIKILVSTPQAQVDGTDASTYTVAQQMAHLDALQTQTAPFVYQDIDGNKYEVDCVDYNQDVIKYDYKNSAADYQVVYNWQLEQVTTGTRA